MILVCLIEAHWRISAQIGHYGTMARTIDTGSVLKDNNESTNVCKVPLAGFKGWNNRMVTVVEPAIKRNCMKIFTGDREEIQKVREESQKWNNSLKDGELLKLTRNCTWVVDYLRDNLYTTKLERSFPIAYSFVVYDSPQQVLRLLRFLYRPTNVYCIHPDKKAKMMSDIFLNIAACLENMIFPSNVVSVTWGHYSLLQAQMSCLTDLVHWRSKQPEQKRWKYVITSCFNA